MALPKLEARITVPTGGYSVSVTHTTPNAGPTTVTIPAGDYYLHSTASGGSASLFTTLAGQLTATMGKTYTVTSDDNTDAGTGTTSIHVSGVVSTAIAWTSTALRDLLGYTADLSGAVTYASTNAALAMWLPTCGRAPGMAPVGSNGYPMTDATVTKSPSGKTRALVYNTVYVDTLGFSQLRGYKAWAYLETVGNESLESSIWPYYKTAPVRYHADRATDGTYVEYRITSVGEINLHALKHGWDGQQALYQWSANVAKYV